MITGCGNSNPYMSVKTKLFLLPVIGLLVLNLTVSNCDASNLTISGVEMGERNPSTKTLNAQFTISWENAWRTKINHDAVWLTFRLHNPDVTPTNKKLCQLTASGLNPITTSTGSANNIEIYVPQDKNGAFVRLNDFDKGATVLANVEIELDYESCGFTAEDSAYLNVFALEMVYIPEGAFYAGDYDTSYAALNSGSADDTPWYIDSGAGISVSNPASNGYRYVSSGQPTEDATGASFTLEEEFPKGYSAFYMMKYEVTESQWVEFINSLPTASARASHDLTDGSHKNTDAVMSRNTISCSGSPLTCSTQRPHRPVSYLSWMNLAAFLDWAALRPMTELEFEKSARGPVLPEEGAFAWGSNQIVAANALSNGDEDGTETVTTPSANANFNNVTLSGGDVVNGPEFDHGPLRVGIFATSASDRISAGAGYYGVMELSGNLKELVVSIGNATGRDFEGTHGDGLLSTATGSEGWANEMDWPGINIQPALGVTGADGSGYRGGAFDDQLSGAKLRISDRTDAAVGDASAYANAGGRGVRTYDGN